MRVCVRYAAHVFTSLQTPSASRRLGFLRKPDRETSERKIMRREREGAGRAGGSFLDRVAVAGGVRGAGQGARIADWLDIKPLKDRNERRRVRRVRRRALCGAHVGNGQGTHARAIAREAGALGRQGGGGSEESRDED